MTGPAGVRYDESTALVVVDLQNDFAHPDGNLYVDEGEEAVAVANREIERARDAGSLVVYTQDWHPPSTPHFEKDGGTWPVHCVRETWGAEFHEDLVVLDTAELVRKGTGGEDGYSGFSVRDPESGEESDTRLDRLLRDHDVARVVVVGLAADVCVKETALDAARRGYETEYLLEATRPVEQEPGDADRALRQVADAGVEIVAANAG